MITSAAIQDSLSTLFMESNQKPRVLIAEDSRIVQRILVSLFLANGFHVQAVLSAKEIFAALRHQTFDTLILDYILPDANGDEVLARIRKEYSPIQLPVVVVSAHHSADILSSSLSRGANDFVRKPFEASELLLRVRNNVRIAMISQRLEDTSEIVVAIAKLVESKDVDTIDHCTRLSRYASNFGKVLGLPSSHIETLRLGGPLHDIGKVSVPDSILFKKGGLTSEEWLVMKSHTTVGYDICHNMRSLRDVLPIIRNHHERYDGGGYPDELRGDEIPLLARVFQIVDIYDALSHARSYKLGFNMQDSLGILAHERDMGWRDPVLVNTFMQNVQEIIT